MLDTITNTPGLADFREPQLIVGAKGTKLQFKSSTTGSRRSLLDFMDHFESFFHDVFDENFVQLDRFYVGNWAYRCALVKQACNEKIVAEQFAVTAYNIKPCDETKILRDQLRKGPTKVEQRLNRLADLMCELEEIVRHVERVVEQDCPSSIAVFQSRLEYVRVTRHRFERHVILQLQEVENASTSLFGVHSSLAEYEMKILHERSSLLFSGPMSRIDLRKRRKVSRGLSSVRNNQNQKKRRSESSCNMTSKYPLAATRKDQPPKINA